MNDEIGLFSNASLDELVRHFLEHCEISRNQSLKTVENYTHYLRRFMEWFPSDNPADISLEKVHEYRLYLNRFKDKRGRSLSRKTQNYHVVALRSFLRFLMKRDVKTLSPEKIELGKDEQRIVDFLTYDEAQMIFQAIDLTAKTGFRDRAILETLFSTGLRVSEMVNLDRDQIDLDRQEFTIRGKGGKLRLVFLSEECTATLKSYMMTREDNWKPLFINMRRSKDGKDFYTGEHKRLTAYSIQEMVRKTALKAGIIKKVTPHTLRHSFATNLLMNGADIRSVQELLGHASITTTQIYTHVTNQKLRETHRQYHSSRNRLHDLTDNMIPPEMTPSAHVADSHDEDCDDALNRPFSESSPVADVIDTDVGSSSYSGTRPLEKLREVEDTI